MKQTMIKAVLTLAVMFMLVNCTKDNDTILSPEANVEFRIQVPDSFDFAGVFIGFSDTAIITMTNIYPFPVILEESTISGSDAFALVNPILSAVSFEYLETYDFLIAFTPNILGQHNGTFIIDNGVSDTTFLTGTGVLSSDPVDDLIDAVNDIGLAEKDAERLTDKLETADWLMENCQINAAIGKLTAFINQTNAYINSGKISETDGEALIAAATALIDDLEANGCPSGDV